MRIYVPRPGSAVLATVLPGSGIVSDGMLDASGRVVIDFEGNRYGSSSMTTFADRVDHATGRHLTRYPTVARLSVLPSDLTAVADYNADLGIISVDGSDEAFLLAQWCQVDTIDDVGLITTSNGRHNRERDWEPYLHSPDPGMRRMAEREFKTRG